MLIEMGDDIFAKNLRYLRQKRRISQKALAEAVGISRYTLRGIESGMMRPALELDAFSKICDLLTVDHDDMVHKAFYAS